MGKKKTPAGVFLAIALLDHLAVGLVLPLLPQYAMSAGVPTHLTSLLGSVYGVSQLLGAPLVFYLASRFGVRTVLPITLVLSGIAYLMTGFATAIWVIVAARVIVGTAKQTLGLAIAAAVDDDRGARAVAIGRINTASTVGYTAGPVVGGALGSLFGQRFPAAVSCAVLCANALFAAAFVSGSPKRETTRGHPEKARENAVNHEKGIAGGSNKDTADNTEHGDRAAKGKGDRCAGPAWVPLSVVTLASLAATASMSTRTTYLVTHLGTPPFTSGAIASLVALGGALAQGIGVHALITAVSVPKGNGRLFGITSKKNAAKAITVVAKEEKEGSIITAGPETESPSIGRPAMDAVSASEWRAVLVSALLSAALLLAAGYASGCPEQQQSSFLNDENNNDGSINDDINNNNNNNSTYNAIISLLTTQKTTLVSYAAFLVAGQSLCGVSRTCAKSLLTKSGGVGGAAALGYASAAESAARIIGPMVGGFLLYWGKESPFATVDLFGSGAMAAVAAVAGFRIAFSRETTGHAKSE